MAAFLAIRAEWLPFNGIYDLPLPGNKVSKDNGFLVSAEFADALNVVPRSAVMVGDVPVGQVEKIVRSGWNARITMLVRNDVVLPDNAVAEIRQTSLLGEKYVELSAPDRSRRQAGRYRQAWPQRRHPDGSDRSQSRGRGSPRRALSSC